MKPLLQSILLAAFFVLPASLVAAGKSRELKIPDFTQGDKIPEGAQHDWNLGATGLRGWIFCDQLVTSDARQIAITQVEKGSPAEGVLAVGDVILGVGGKAFSHDPRTELGKALTLAEWQALDPAKHDVGTTLNTTMPSGAEIVAWGRVLVGM